MSPTEQGGSQETEGGNKRRKLNDESSFSNPTFESDSDEADEATPRKGSGQRSSNTSSKSESTTAETKNLTPPQSPTPLLEQEPEVLETAEPAQQNQPLLQQNEQPVQLDEQQVQQNEQPVQQNEQQVQLDEQQVQQNEQQVQQNEQPVQLDEQQAQLDEQLVQLDEQQVQLDEQQAQLDEQQAQLDELQAQLDEQQAQLDEQQNQQHAPVEPVQAINWDAPNVVDIMGNAAWNEQPAPEIAQQVLAHFHEAIVNIDQTSTQIRNVLQNAGILWTGGFQTIQLARLGIELLRDPQFLGGDAARQDFDVILNDYFNIVGGEALSSEGVGILDQLVNAIPMLAVAAVHLHAAVDEEAPLQSFEDLVDIIGDVDELEADDAGGIDEAIEARDDLENAVGNVLVLLSPLPFAPPFQM